MNDGAIPRIERYVAAFHRGIIVEHELVDGMLCAFVDHDSSNDDVNVAFALIPSTIYNGLRLRLHDLAAADFYWKPFRIGDIRTKQDIHADTLARQPILRRIHQTLDRLLSIQLARDWPHQTG